MTTVILRNPPEWAKGPYEFIWHSLCQERFFQLSEKAREMLTSPQTPNTEALQNVLCDLSKHEAPTTTSEEDTSSSILAKLFQRLFISAEIRSFGSTVDLSQKNYIIALAALGAVAVSKHIVLTDRERLLEWLSEVLVPKKRKRRDDNCFSFGEEDQEAPRRSFEDHVRGYLRGQIQGRGTHLNTHVAAAAALGGTERPPATPRTSRKIRRALQKAVVGATPIPEGMYIVVNVSLRPGRRLLLMKYLLRKEVQKLGSTALHFLLLPDYEKTIHKTFSFDMSLNDINPMQLKQVRVIAVSTVPLAISFAGIEGVSTDTPLGGPLGSLPAQYHTAPLVAARRNGWYYALRFFDSLVRSEASRVQFSAYDGWWTDSGAIQSLPSIVFERLKAYKPFFPSFCSFKYGFNACDSKKEIVHILDGDSIQLERVSVTVFEGDSLALLGTQRKDVFRKWRVAAEELTDDTRFERYRGSPRFLDRPVLYTFSRYGVYFIIVVPITFKKSFDDYSEFVVSFPFYNNFRLQKEAHPTIHDWEKKRWTKLKYYKVPRHFEPNDDFTSTYGGSGRLEHTTLTNMSTFSLFDHSVVLPRDFTGTHVNNTYDYAARGKEVLYEVRPGRAPLCIVPILPNELRHKLMEFLSIADALTSLRMVNHSCLAWLRPWYDLLLCRMVRDNTYQYHTSPGQAEGHPITSDLLQTPALYALSVAPRMRRLPIPNTQGMKRVLCTHLQFFACDIDEDYAHCSMGYWRGRYLFFICLGTDTYVYRFRSQGLIEAFLQVLPGSGQGLIH